MSAPTASPNASGTALPPRAVESRDPATGEVWGRYVAADEAAVRHAVERARAAQAGWRETPIATRARAIERFRRALFAQRREMAETITRENGKPLVEAGSETLLVLDFARYYATTAPAALHHERIRPASLALWRKRVHVAHVPFGAVGVISPWNYPLMLAAGVILPALVAGNAVVHKPSEWTPGTAMLLDALLRDAGLPEGLYHTTLGAGATGAALLAAGCDKIFFTGSEATGRKVAMACAERLIPCVLELGGSDPAIVLRDADLDLAARGIAWGRTSNGGQTCVAPKRVFVESPVYDAFLAKLGAAVAALRVGPGIDGAHDVGPLIRPEQVELLRAQEDDALARGARVVARASTPAAAGYASPTVLADVTPEMRVLREETFGPLLPVVRVRDADEAVELANATSFGLSASVWGRDAARLRAVAARVEAGSVVLNDSVVAAGMPNVPHGGVKASGTGRAHGVAGLMECVQSKTVVEERLPGLPQLWWHAYSPALAEALDAFVRFAHGRGALARLRALVGARALGARLRRRR